MTSPQQAFWLGRLVRVGKLTEAAAFALNKLGTIKNLPLPASVGLTPRELKGAFIQAYQGRWAGEGAIRLNRSTAIRAIQRERLQSQFEKQAAGLARSVANGKITVATWQTRMADAISNHSLRQAALGRGATMSKAEAIAFSNARIRPQLAFLQRFADEIALGKVTGEPLTAAQIANRSALYAGDGRAAWFQEHEKRDARPGYVAVYRARDDKGTCLLPGSLVLTDNGWLAVEQIAPGAMLLTGDGDYQPVTAIWQKQATEAVRITVDERTLAVTPDHPVLVERQGQLLWMDAGIVCAGDRVFVPQPVKPDAELRATNNTLGHTFNAIPAKSGAFSLGSVAGLNFGSAVPVIPVHLNEKVSGGNIQVEHVAFAVAGDELTHDLSPNAFKGHTGEAFRFSLSGEAAVTLEATKAGFGSGSPRCRPKGLVAGQAGDNDCWASASLGAIRSVGSPFGVEGFTATLTVDDELTDVLASTRTVNRSDAGRFANNELTKTLRTDLGDVLVREPALFTAIGLASNLITAPFECRSASLAGANIRRFGPSTQYAATKTVSGSLLPASCDSADHATIDTSNSLHDSLIIPDGIENRFMVSEVTDIAAFDIATDVFDLSLAEGHTFFADGVLVHNCGPCLQAEGTFLPGEGSMPGDVCKGRGRCRCTRELVMDAAAYARLTGAEVRQAN